MKNIPPLLLLVLAVVFGGFAAYIASGWLKARARPAARDSVAMMPAVAAARNIAPGSVLIPELLKVVQLPKEHVAADAATDLKALEGRVTRQLIVAGEVIQEHELAPKGAPGGMAGIIGNDKRAVTIKVDEASGVAGFIVPGNRVDVLLSLDRNEFKNDPVTQIVLQNLPVLGTGQDIEQQKAGERPKVVPTVTLEVTPEEGERLALAAKEGTITLALRGWTEKAAIPTAGARVSALLTPEKKAAANFEGPIPPPAKVGVEVIRGVGREMVNF
ncbi:Flp pilus assembly protein CpaB [Desulfobacca acetoxidans]|uniref:Flp pilus assembly protein CpaB n=1 Tax=Desulfobacca acetoxidans (strain ATCC 700848 / DSM 11109 / ASRB2) TaxID=880072 RepID=F2NJX1_DESAR|nr:Flp pilus assembly protein CpaB [Desulfobacca acetoxidans]AEB09915.1 Flp pilus assembly protein CpaB [Desulfobacca acetoxidans DSM 11109]